MPSGAVSGTAGRTPSDPRAPHARDLRWLADSYDQAQHARIDSGDRMLAIVRSRASHDTVHAGDTDGARLLADIRNGATDGPVELLGRAYRRHWQAEQELRRAMTLAVADHPAWPWLGRVKGVGTMFAAQLLARLDVHRAPHPSSFWAYCGLATVPGIEYHCTACRLRVSHPVRHRIDPRHNRPRTATTCTGVLEPCRGPDDNVRVAQPRPEAGERATYDQRARKLCDLIGASFLRSPSPYGDHYRREHARLAKARPGWTGRRIHFAALRRTEKLFLAHLWVVWRRAEGLPYGTPYARAARNRAEYIPPEAMIGAAEPPAALKRSDESAKPE